MYHDAGELLALLQAKKEEAGGIEPVKLVRGSWMLRRAKMLRAATSDAERERLRVPRRQELERVAPGALLTPAQAAAMGRGHSGDANCLFCRGDVPARQPLKLVAISQYALA